MKSGLRNIGFYAVLLVLLALFVEGASYLTFRFVLGGRDFLYADLDRIKSIITEKQLLEQKNSFDEDLGWVYPAGLSKELTVGDYNWQFRMDERGARYNPYQGGGGLISIYGDSYAFGADVDDDETWGYHLSKLAETRVDNWGTPAYGTDQGVLRVRKNFPEHPTDIVILSLVDHNINRIMNAYRPFYSRDLGLKIGFKPMLYETDDGLQWLPNPLRKLESLADFHSAFERAKQVDYWYQLNGQRPRAEFPYALSALSALKFQVIRPPRDLYESPRATARLDRVLAELVELGDEYGFQTVIVCIRYVGSSSEAFEAYVRKVTERARSDGALVVDLLESNVHRETVGNEQTGMHLSPRGNELLARAVYDALSAQAVPLNRASR